MFDMSADDAGWLITLIVVVALMAILIGARWFWEAGFPWRLAAR